jgi:UDP-glucose 4-epimerase
MKTLEKYTASTRYDGRHVLVTGGAGFIGSHLCEALLNRGFDVTIVDKMWNGQYENIQGIAPELTVYEFDVCSLTFREFLLDTKPNVIFHLAGIASVPLSVKNPPIDFRNNLEGSFQLLESLRIGGLNSILIVASSAAVYGNPSRIPIMETDPTIPISPYGVSKLAMERYVSVYSKLYGIRAASLRPFSAYGPRLRKQIVYDLISRITENPSELTLLGDGTQVRDLIYVDDLVQAALAVLDYAPLEGEAYNVAEGRGYTVQEIAETLVNSIGLKTQIRYSGRTRAGDPDQWIACVDKIRSLGFKCTVSLEDGFKRTIQWYQANLVEKIGQFS